MKKQFFGYLVIFVFLACGPSEEEKAPEGDLIKNQMDYYANGKKKMEGKLLNGKRHGKWIAYHENGMKWSEGTFNQGVREGKATIYYESGKKKMEGQYQQNMKIGPWKVWEETGELVAEVNLNEMLSPQDSILLELKRPAKED